MNDQPPVVNGRTFEPPGKGPWELETTHSSRPMTAIIQAGFIDGFTKGFAEGTKRYGVLLSHLEPGFSHSFLYNQPVPVGAPEGAMGPPPKPVLQLISRIHPEMRRRHKAAERAIREKLWREDLAIWDDVDKPAAIEAHRSIQSVDVGALSDALLADHVDRCAQHVIDNVYLHHKYTIPACLPVGDFLAGAMEWTGASIGELMGPLRGRSVISRGFAAEELDTAAKALTTSDSARAILAAAGDSDAILADLAAHPEVGADVTAYLDAVRWRCVGYDLGDRAAGELPDTLVEALRSTLAGAWSAPPDDDSALQALRERVPAEHREDFDDRLAEVRLIYRLRDERGVFADGWAVGLARRAMLEVGRRLAGKGLLTDPEHAVELDRGEARALLLGTGAGPKAAEVADRFDWRTSVTTSDAPAFLRALPPPPPPVEWFPAPARRTAAAMNIFLFSLFGVPETPNSDTVLTGLAVNTGVYEGVARLVEDSADFGRIRKGDVLVTRMTSPYFNVVLPMLGAIVTDRGGQLCHAAIVAREYGIPGIVGTRDATRTIVDGARVRVDGSTGEVHVLG
jgi:rifampicin phosphotransferase